MIEIINVVLAIVVKTNFGIKTQKNMFLYFDKNNNNIE